MTLDKRDWQKDMELLQKKPKFTIDEVNYIIYSIAPHWMKEAQVYKQSYEGTLREYEAEKARADAAEARELRIRTELESMMPDMWPSMREHFAVLLSTLYPDTPAQPAAPAPEITARPIEEWHEDMGCVIWWEFPISEPPHCGTPMDIDWPGYHTHWTPIVIPASPAPKERKGIEVTMTLEYGGKIPKRPRIEVEEGDNQ